jgi:hypothetical protein
VASRVEEREEPRTFGRRRALRAAIAGGVIAATAGIVGLVRTSGYAVPDERAKKLKALSPWQLIVVEHVARRIAAPDQEGVVSTDEIDVAGFVDGYVAGMHPTVRRDLLRLIGFIEHVAPVGCGYVSRFTKLRAADQDKVLASLESSSQDLLRAGFEGIKCLVFMGYYRDARTWRVLGYDGPLVNRPPQGWDKG